MASGLDRIDRCQVCYFAYMIHSGFQLDMFKLYPFSAEAGCRLVFLMHSRRPDQAIARASDTFRCGVFSSNMVQWAIWPAQCSRLENDDAA